MTHSFSDTAVFAAAVPKITIVTPSYNQGRYLEETIQSVLGQCYPNLEYIVMDGGSTDNSIEIIKKYEKHLAYWVSETDGGQSAAINSGFARATGEILGWLNSDDMYLPGALSFAAGRLDVLKPEIIFGNCLHITENSAASYGSDVVSAHNSESLAIHDYLIQPSTFWTKNAWDAVGSLDQNLHYGFDWEWFLRARQAEVGFKPVNRHLSVYRLHEAHKTGTGGDQRQQELAGIYEKHAGAGYKESYLQCCRSGEEVTKFMAQLQRRPLSRLAAPLLRLRFPHLFRRASVEEILLLIRMR